MKREKVSTIGIALTVADPKRINELGALLRGAFPNVDVRKKTGGIEADTTEPSAEFLDRIGIMEKLNAGSESVRTTRIGEWPELTASAV